MRQTCELAPTDAIRPASSIDALAEMSAAVIRLREGLLDYNPVLAVMADALHRAVELELEAHRCNHWVDRESL